MATKIKATKDLYYKEGEKSFTKGNEYSIDNMSVYQQHELIDRTTTNDQGEPHKIGMWYKHFKILRSGV